MTSTVYRDRRRSSLLPTPERSVRAYLDFVAGVKVFAQQRLTPAVRAEYDRRSAAAGRPPATGQEAEELLRGSVGRAFLATLLRTSQEMMWDGAARAVTSAGPALRQALEEPLEHALGSLMLDPELDQRLPRFVVEYDFHIQPGAYTRDDLAGPIYEVGAAIYSSRPDYDNQTERAFALGLALDEAQRPAAVLELGCGVGKSPVRCRALPERRRRPPRDRHLLSYVPLCAPPPGRARPGGPRASSQRRRPAVRRRLVRPGVCQDPVPRAADGRRARVDRRVVSCAAVRRPAGDRRHHAVSVRRRLHADALRLAGTPQRRALLARVTQPRLRRHLSRSGLRGYHRAAERLRPIARAFPWFTIGRKP
jgi:hypothetical protein